MITKITQSQAGCSASLMFLDTDALIVSSECVQLVLNYYLGRSTGVSSALVTGLAKNPNQGTILDMKEPLVLGVISDTHHLVRPLVHELFIGVDYILHAGDVGDATVLLELETIAPVYAVLGNTDQGLQLPNELLITLKGWTIFITHCLDSRNDNLAKILAARHDPQVDLVITGHTHATHSYARNGTWFVNPGSAGPERFKTKATVMLLKLLPECEPAIRILQLPT